MHQADKAVTLQLIWFNVVTVSGEAAQQLCQDMDWKPSGPWGLVSRWLVRASIAKESNITLW